jgi:ribosomal protein S18
MAGDGAQVVGGVAVQLQAIGEQQVSGALARVRTEAQKSANAMQAGSVQGKKFGLAMQQLSYGIQDALTVWGNTGLRGALIASSNNFAQVFSIIGPMTGAIGGMAVQITASLIPAFASMLGLADTTAAAFKRMTNEFENDMDVFKKLQAVRLAGAESGVKASQMDAKALFDQTRNLQIQMAEQERTVEKSKKAQGEAIVSAQREMMIGRGAAGQVGEMWQNLWELNPLQAPDAWKKRVDYAKAYEAYGRRIMEQSKINPTEAAKTEAGRQRALQMTVGGEPLVYKMGMNPTDPRMLAQAIGRRAYERSPQAVPRDLSRLFITPEEQEKSVNAETGPENVKAAAKQVQEATAQRDVTKIELENARKNQRLALEEELYKGLYLKGGQRMDIERERLRMTLQAQQSGVPQNSPIFQAINTLAEKRGREIEEHVSGVTDVTQVHNMIQNLILQGNDARRTAENTDAMAKDLHQILVRPLPPGAEGLPSVFK